MDKMKINMVKDYLSDLPEGGIVLCQEDGNSERQWVIESDSLSLTINFDTPLGEGRERKLVTFLADGKNLLKYLLEEAEHWIGNNDDLMRSFHVVFTQLMDENTALKKTVALITDTVDEVKQEQEDVSG
jgi:hypothetical protein